MAPTLTREQAIEMQDALVSEYSKPEFQRQLRAAYEAAGSDLLRQGRARQETCLPIQGPIISKYGFEASRRGVAMSVAAFTPELNADPAVNANNMRLARLVNPQLLAELDAKREADALDAAKPAIVAEASNDGEPGRRWRVTGGHAHGGIMVRRGQDLHSPVLAARLATGSLVEEIEKVGERLHYSKVSGDGPDFGWVSVSLKGAHLLEPVSEP